MRNRLAALLLALSTLCGVIALAPPAAADDKPGIIGSLAQAGCDYGVVGAYDYLTDGHHCEHIGETVDRTIEAEWNGVWDSTIGELLKAGIAFVKALVKFTLTVALQGPSLRLEDTGLFGEHATLAGVMVWLGLIISAVGLMWQIGRMAVTGQMRHLGQALSGWLQNCLLCVGGIAGVALLLRAGDALTDGLVDSTFGDTGTATGHIVDILVPHVVNPFIVICGLLVLVPVGFVQLVLIFLRNSAIPIQCLLLPIAGAGRVGGETTRKWAPLLIRSILIGIFYRPMDAVIICTGFAEFGHADSVVEWLRGLTTLLLGALAPAALVRIFGPVADEVGTAMGSGGAVAAMSAAGAYASRRGHGGAADSEGAGAEGGSGATSAVEHARRVEQSMSTSPGVDEQSSTGGDALSQAARNQAARVPGPAAPLDGATGADGTPGSGGSGFASGAAGAGAAGAAAGGAGLAIQVLDGLNSAVQRGAGEIGNGSEGQL
ncbi:hypothetical protein ACFVXG_01430 [Kitasatospora sp. NPDC058162]|uniref:hypothetical protein n=1 Tax=Kitasatospora sp. NPDC058162 TaxID=3346362 RepID=UPI0036D760FE